MYSSNSVVEAVINPKTKEAAVAAWYIKRWTIYKKLLNYTFDSNNAQAASIAYKDLLSFITTVVPFNSTDITQKYLAHTVSITSVDDFVKLFSERELIDRFGFYSGVPLKLQKSDDTKTVVKTQPAKGDNNKPAVISKPDIKPTEIQINDSASFIRTKQNTYKYTKPKGYIKDTKKWKNYVIPNGVPLDLDADRYFWMVCYDSTNPDISTLRMYQVDPRGWFNRCSPCARSSKNPANAYNIAVMRKYSEEMKCNRRNVRMCMLKTMVSRLANKH